MFPLFFLHLSLPSIKTTKLLIFNTILFSILYPKMLSYGYGVDVGTPLTGIRSDESKSEGNMK
jgi:hypothetical protein